MDLANQYSTIFLVQLITSLILDTVILETTAIRHITFFVLMGFDNCILDYSIVVSDFLHYMRILLMIITLKKM